MTDRVLFKGPGVIKNAYGVNVVTVDADGIVTFSNTPVLESADLDDDLDAVAALSATGIAARTGSGTWSARTITASSNIEVTYGDGVSGNPTIAAVGENLLLNGDFQVAQRGTSFTGGTANADDAYTLDQWIVLSEGSDTVDVTQETTIVPTGRNQAIKLEVETANEKFGILQILENQRCANILDGSTSVTLSFQARNAASDDNTDKLYAAILSWASTADAPTSDVVGTWGAEDTLPTAALASNWTMEGETSAVTLTQTFQDVELTAVVDTASAANVAVFIWCENDDGAVDDAVIIADVKLEIGAAATAFRSRDYTDEVRLCRRYFERIGGDTDATLAAGWAYSTTVARFPISWQEKRSSAPTVTNAAYTTFDVFYENTSSTLDSAFAVVAAHRSKDAATFAATMGSGTFTAGQGVSLRANAAGGYIDVSAEL